MKFVSVMLIALLAATTLACEEKPPMSEVAPKPFAGFPPGDEPPVEPSAEVDLPNKSQPHEGFVAAGQPSPEQFDDLKAAGYTAVINLRSPDEPGYWDEREKATRHFMLYKHIPIAGPQDFTREKVEEFAKTLQEPLARDGKVLVHCGTGNRVGAMVALKAHWIDGRSVEDALELGRKAGLTSLEPAVKEQLQKG